MPRRRRPPRAGALTELPPLKILTQIAVLQALFYLNILVLTLFNALVAGQPFSLDLIFGWEGVRGDTTQGWFLGFLWVLDGGFVMAVAMVAILTRSKLVPDFSITTHFIHLVVVTFWTGSFPLDPFWWITMIASSAMGISLGMWGCQYRELQPVSFGGKPTVRTAAKGSAGANATENGGAAMDVGMGDEEQGFVSGRGRGRGRGRDGAGEYEMVKMDGVDSG